MEKLFGSLPRGVTGSLNVINSSPTGAGQGSEGSTYFHQMKAHVQADTSSTFGKD